MSTIGEIPPELDTHLREGKVLVAASVADGPYAGAGILCITSRSEIQDILTELSKMKANKLRRMLRSVVIAVRQGLQDRATSPSDNQDLMADLPLLLAARILWGEEVLKGTHVKRLNLWVHRDQERNWDERGMLDPDLMKELGAELTISDFEAIEMSDDTTPSIH
jgi:hypothetical protein